MNESEEGGRGQHTTRSVDKLRTAVRPKFLPCSVMVTPPAVGTPVVGRIWSICGLANENVRVLLRNTQHNH